MKKNKALTVLMFIFMMIISSTKPVYAETSTPITISPAYANISSTTTALTGSSGKASCQSTIVAYSTSADLKIFMYLEKYVGGTWTPYSSWSSSKTGSNLTLSKSISVASGTYRVKASYYANGENTVKYSATKTF